MRTVSTLLCLLAVFHAPTRSHGASLGHVYAISSNGTTNELQVVDVDLTTWAIRVSAPYPGFTAFGQAAAVQNGTFWTFLMDDTGCYLAGFDTGTLALVTVLNTSSWVDAGRCVFIDDVFAFPSNESLLVIGRADSSGLQAFYVVADPHDGTGAAQLLGSVSCVDCGDITWDAATGTLYEIEGEDDENDSGNLIVVSLQGNGSKPSVVGNFTLANHFSFPQWDAATRTLTGLSLSSTPAGYARNVSRMAVTAMGYNVTDHGALGDGFFVILTDGPKAFDPVTRRAFYMLANGPFAEFDVAAINIDAVPPLIEEAPGLCGFIGYCPQGFAFGP